MLVNAGRLYMPEYGMHVFLYCLVCNTLIPKENVTPSSFASDSLEVQGFSGARRKKDSCLEEYL